VDPSVGHAIDVNGSGVTANLGSSAPQQDPLRHDGTSDTQRMHPQLLSSSERRHHPLPDRISRPSPYTPDRERPPHREIRPYDRERDGDKVHENERLYEQDRERERERRWSLTDNRRINLDRRSFDSDRRPPPDSRRRPSFERRPPQVGDDRRPLQNDDRRPPHFEDRQPPTFADRRIPDDRRYSVNERRPLSEEVHIGNAPHQNLSQEALSERERHLGPAQAIKSLVPTPSSVPSSTTTVNLASDPVDLAASCAVAGNHGLSSSSSMSIDSQGTISASRFAATPLEGRSGQTSSLPRHVSGPFPQLGSQTEQARPVIPLEERLTKPLENMGTTPTSLPGTNQAIHGLLHTRASEPSRAIDLRPGLDDDQGRYSLLTGDNQTRPVSAAYTHPLSVGRDESRLQPPPPRAPTPSAFPSAQSSLPFRPRDPSREPPLPPQTSTPQGFSSAQSTLPPRAREHSRERPPNLRPPYLRSDLSRPPEENRRSDAHSLQPDDSTRRYHERRRWTPPPYGERHNYREHYDRDRQYWDGKDRARDRPPLPHQPQPPPTWERERARYSELPYSGAGLERRFEDRDQGNRDKWYQPPYDNPSRRQFDTFAPRGRPRSPISPSREPSELRPPPPKRVREDAYIGRPSHPVTGDDYYPHPHPHHPPPTMSSLNKEPPPPSVPTPVPIPIPRPASPPLRYNHNRPPPLEPYGSTYGGYERDGGRGPGGPSYVREGPR
jgi:hypothetical protein